MGLKPGDKVRTLGSPRRHAVVEAVGCAGVESIRCRMANGYTFYASQWDLRKENEPDDPKDKKSIKKQANLLTQERINKIKTMNEKEKQKLPTFQELSEKFYALARFTEHNAEDQTNSIIVQLAEKQLYEEAKNGCTWDGKIGG